MYLQKINEVHGSITRYLQNVTHSHELGSRLNRILLNLKNSTMNGFFPFRLSLVLH